MDRPPEHVVVVGAGMVGLSTAWFLQEEGLRVSVVEARGVAAGSSWGNAGWLAPALTLPLPDPAILGVGLRALVTPSSPVYVPPTANPRLLRWLLDFARHCTQRRWRAAMTVFAQANAAALEAFDRVTTSEPTKPAAPFLAAFATADDRAVLTAELDAVARLGGEAAYELLDGAALHDLEPSLGPGAAVGVRLAGQRFVDPGRYVHALADAVVARGAELVLGTVDDVDRDADGVRVSGPDLEVRADAVVLATGTWLGRLARDHGVRKVVQAGRGYSFTVRPGHQPRGPVYFPTQRVACTPLGPPGAEDRFRVAGMMEFRRPDAPLDPRRVHAIVAAARPMLSGVDWEARTDEWVGSRPCTADGLPLVGATRTPGVFVAGGHGMWGMALGPLTGRIVAGLIAGTRRDPLLAPFDPLR